jgi:hypothetical protein
MAAVIFWPSGKTLAKAVTLRIYPFILISVSLQFLENEALS